MKRFKDQPTVELGEVLAYEQPTNYIVENEQYNDSYETPVLTAGKSFLLGYTDEKKNIFNDLPVIIFDDFTTASKYVDFPFKVKSSAMKILKPDKSRADARFLFHLMQTLPFDPERHKRYWISEYSKLQIPLPPLSIQKKIAARLDAADALRKKDQQLLKKYDELAQSIFIDMFGDPVLNEKGWKIKKLKDFGTWKSGGTPTRSINRYFQGSIPWLSSGELNNIFVSSSKEQISKEAIENSAASIIERGCLLLGMYDTAALKSSINQVELSCNQAIAFSKLDEGLIDTIYTYYFIQIGKDYLKKEQRGVRQKNMNLKMIKNIKIMCPPLSLQTEFVKKIENIEQQKTLARQQAAKSEMLFQSLLQNSFIGEKDR